MPFKSEAQRKYFNANREKLEAEGVDVDEWNESSKGKKLPEKAEKKAANYSVIQNMAWISAQQEKSAAPYLRNSLIGAGIGGLTGGIGDWMNEDEDKPADSLLDGILGGAALGGMGGLGYTALRDLRNPNRLAAAEPNYNNRPPQYGRNQFKDNNYLPVVDPDKLDLHPAEVAQLKEQGYLRGPRAKLSELPSSLDRDAKSLADVLPENYREEAQRSAQRYRDSGNYMIDSAERDNPFLQDISDKAIDRKVDIERMSQEDLATLGGNKNAGGAHMSRVDNPWAILEDGTQVLLDGPQALGDKIILPTGPVNQSTLGHELTHASQDRYTPGSRRDMKRPYYKDNVKNLIENNSRKFGAPPERLADYVTSPMEEEAYLSEIKRRYFRATGKHVRNQADARKAIEWVKKSKNSESDLMDFFLRDSTMDQRSHGDREEWIRGLVERLPGLVSNEKFNSGIKTAGTSGMTNHNIANLAKVAAQEKQANIAALKNLGKGALNFGKQVWNPTTGKQIIGQNLGQAGLGGAAGYAGVGAADPSATMEQKILGGLGGAGMATPAFRRFLMDKGVDKFRNAPIMARAKADQALKSMGSDIPTSPLKPMGENTAKGLGLASGMLPAAAGKAGLIYGMGIAGKVDKTMQGVEETIKQLNEQPDTYTITGNDGKKKTVSKEVFDKLKWEKSGPRKSLDEQVAEAQAMVDRGASGDRDVSGIAGLNRTGRNLADITGTIESGAGEATQNIVDATEGVADAAGGLDKLVETTEGAAGGIGDVAKSTREFTDSVKPVAQLADTINSGMQAAGDGIKSFGGWVKNNSGKLGLGVLGAGGLYGLYKVLQNRSKQKEEEEEERSRYVYKMPKRAADFGKLAAGRCWDGYEPVPGKKAYSDGSCTQVAEKKKKKSEKKSSDIATLAELAVMQKQAENKPLRTALTVSPHTAIFGGTMGAGVGGLHGLLKDPGYDEETGDKKSRLMNALKGMGVGGAVGAGAGALLPPASVLATQGYGKFLMPLHKRIGELQEDTSNEDPGFTRS